MRSASRCRASSTVDPLLVVEHVTRIDDDCAPDWPQSDVAGRRAPGALTGHPNLDVSVHGTEPGEPGRGRRRQRHRGQPHRERHPGGVRRARGPAQPARPPADHRRRAAPPLTAPASNRVRCRPGSPSSRRRYSEDASICGSRWLMRRPTGCE